MGKIRKTFASEQTIPQEWRRSSQYRATTCLPSSRPMFIPLITMFLYGTAPVAKSFSFGNSACSSTRKITTRQTYYPQLPINDGMSLFLSSPDNDIHQEITSDQESIATAETSTSNTNPEYSFFDEAIIYVRAGSGGQGSSTFKKGTGGQDGPPDGGSGGRGGNVIFEVDPSLNTLAGLNTQAYRPNAFGGSGAAVHKHDYSSTSYKSFRAEHGADGERQFKNGRYGQHVTIRLPPGTVVQEEITKKDGAIFYKDMGSLTVDEPTMVVAQGGEGGEGSGVASKSRGVRRKRIAPQGGEKKTIKLTLKIVADVALVGTPNAGKSTFLAAVTRAKPKIANYPFTTVIPNLGVWIPPSSEYQDEQLNGAGSEGLALCDVPGLIEGAARGIGLGHAFLRHIERCHIILHLVDPTAEDPVGNFHMINREIIKYGTGQLAQMPQVVVVNKCDLWDSDTEKPTLTREKVEKELRQAMTHTRLMWMSAKEKEGVDDLMIRLNSFVKKVKHAQEPGKEQ